MTRPKLDAVSVEPLLPAFSRIQLMLVREPGHPDGRRNYGYDLVVPLDSSGRLDASLWKRDRFRFARFKPGAEREAGHLVHRPGGSWAFHYHIRGDEDDASGYRFQNERFVVGEYVSAREADGFHTYQVVAVGPV